MTGVWWMLAAFCRALALAPLRIGVRQKAAANLLLRAASFSVAGISARQLVATRTPTVGARV